MWLGAGVFIQDLGNDLRPPITCFDFGALKICRKDSQQSRLNQPTGTSEPWELRGAVLRIPTLYFSEALLLGRGGVGPLIKEGPTLVV